METTTPSPEEAEEGAPSSRWYPQRKTEAGENISKVKAQPPLPEDVGAGAPPSKQYPQADDVGVKSAS